MIRVRAMTVINAASAGEIIRRDAVSAEAEIKYRKIIGGEMKRDANARRGRLTMSEDKVVGLKSMSIEG